MPAALPYRRARDLVLVTGVVVLAAVVATMVLRGVDPVEVVATLLFAPVFVGFLFFSPLVGAALAVVAAGVYVGMRLPAIELVGFPVLSGLILSRVGGYLAFGLVGGWAASQLRRTLDKLELYDEVDDETGLGNGRAFLHAVDRERARAARYSTLFSVVTATFEAADGRKGAARMRDLGTRLAASARGSDRACHARDGERHVVAVVLPETGAEGAATVAANLERRVGEYAAGSVALAQATFPGDDDALDRIVDHLRRLDAAGRP